MIPLLLISKDSKLIKKYVDNLKIGSLFFEIKASTKEYSIDDIRNIKKEVKIFNPRIRIYLLSDFHRSSIPAQNSFLKLLEEPPANVQFILTTDNKNRLLPTVVSRTKVVKLGGNEIVKETEPSLVPEILGLKIPLLYFKITDKESAKNTLRQIIIFFRERLATDKNAPVIIKEILRLKGLLENNNLNPQLTIDQLLIFIWKRYIKKL